MNPNEIFKAINSGPRGTRHKLTFPVRNARFHAEGSPFVGDYVPDDSKAYVEFEICHSLPFVAGPAHVGGYGGFHPAALSRSHHRLRHQQTNLNHMLRAYDPENIPHDRIIGAVVDTYYPPEPEGGWTIPDSPDDAIPMRVLGVVFKAAQGALDMLTKHVDGKQTWSVSIEATANGLADIGIWIPDRRELIPILSADDALLEKVSRGDNGEIKLGNDDSGNPLALCLGAIDGMIIFEGVGYTTMPAEAAAEIVGVRMERAAGSGDAEFEFATSLRKNWPSIWRMTCRLQGLRTPEEAFSEWAVVRQHRKPEAEKSWNASRAKAASILSTMQGPPAAVARLKWGLATQQDLADIDALKLRRTARNA